VDVEGWYSTANMYKYWQSRVVSSNWSEDELIQLQADALN